MLNLNPQTAGPQPLQHATLSWDVTRACNLNCAHCSNADDRGSSGADLRLQDAVHLFAEFRQQGGTHVHLLGGEPLLRKDLLMLLEAAVRLGLGTSLTTNGWYLPDALALPRLLENLQTLTVSLDGHTAALNDPIRGNGSFKRAVSAIGRYVSTRDALGLPVKLNVSHVLCASNVECLEGMIGLCRTLGVDSLSVTVLKTYGNGLQADAPCVPPVAALLAAWHRAAQMGSTPECRTVLFEVPMRVRRQLQARYGESLAFGSDAFCDAAVGQLRVSSDGLVFPCFAGSKHMLQAAGDKPGIDVRTASVEQILATPQYRDFVASTDDLLAHTRWPICAGCTHFLARACYPGCPHDAHNMKPQLCALLMQETSP